MDPEQPIQPARPQPGRDRAGMHRLFSDVGVTPVELEGDLWGRQSGQDLLQLLQRDAGEAVGADGHDERDGVPLSQAPVGAGLYLTCSIMGAALTGPARELSGTKHTCMPSGESICPPRRGSAITKNA